MVMKYPGMAIHFIGIALAGIWLVSTSLNSIFPELRVIDKKELKGNEILNEE